MPSASLLDISKGQIIAATVAAAVLTVNGVSITGSGGGGPGPTGPAGPAGTNGSAGVPGSVGPTGPAAASSTISTIVYSSDVNARDQGGILFGVLYNNTSNTTAISRQMAAQYFYNIGGSTVYTQGRGVQVASGLSGTPDFTIEAWVQLTSNTVAQTFFEIGNSASSGGTIAMGVDTSGKLTLTIDRANPGSTFVHTPGSVSLPIGTWFHVGCVLQTKWDANTYQVCSLYNGACTLGLSYAKSIFSSGMGSICQMGQLWQHFVPHRIDHQL